MATNVLCFFIRFFIWVLDVEYWALNGSYWAKATSLDTRWCCENKKGRKKLSINPVKDSKAINLWVTASSLLLRSSKQIQRAWFCLRLSISTSYKIRLALETQGVKEKNNPIKGFKTDWTVCVWRYEKTSCSCWKSPVIYAGVFESLKTHKLLDKDNFLSRVDTFPLK